MAKRKNAGGKKSAKMVRVEFRRNRNRPARDRSWTRQFHQHGFEQTDTQSVENVVAKGDLSRKRTVRDDEETARLPVGRVVAMRGLIADVRINNVIVHCTVRRILRTRLIRERHPVTVGDEVRVSLPSGQAAPSAERNDSASPSRGVIEWVAPRRGCLTRKYGNRIHTMVANVDQALIISSVAQPYCKPHLIDRYLVAAHAGGIEPFIVFNKIDLDENNTIDEIRSRYDDLQYPTLLTSAPTGYGISELRDVLRDHTSVLVGQSGVGKSTLLNRVQPDLNLTTGEVSEDTQKGTHTTTTAVLLTLETGGFVVDTPGVKTLELADVTPYELEMYFVDIERFVADCKFPDCSHTHESDCAVKNAVEDGNIHPERYESYVRLFSGE